MIARIHTWAGLLTFANLLLYAVVGISSIFVRPAAPPTVVWEQPFAPPAGQSDRQLAERVVRLLDLSLATPVHDFAIGHDAAHRLVLDFYHVNGRDKVTVLDGRLRVEHTRASLWKYLSTLHVTTAAFHSGDRRMQFWAWWNEFAMWSLLVMTGTGAWLWLARRRAKGTWRVVHRYTALAMAALLAIYGVSAVHMAHRTWRAAALLAWLDRLHRMRGLSLAPLLALGLLTLATTGLALSFPRPPRTRTLAAPLLALGCTLTLLLTIWMRL